LAQNDLKGDSSINSRIIVLVEGPTDNQGLTEVRHGTAGFCDF
jgi:hypothetical protein